MAFARALIADPRILVLDEATANVDIHTEGRIEAGLRRLLAGRTAIVIAHRLSTIRTAGRIVVLDHGRIVEQGTHDELLAAEGAYWRLYRDWAEQARGLTPVHRASDAGAQADDMHTAMSRLALTFLLALACCLAPAAAQAAGTVDLIVRRDAGLSAAQRADIRADAGVDLERGLRLTDTELVSVPADQAADALRALEADPDVRWAMRDRPVQATAVTEQDAYWGRPVGAAQHRPDARRRGPAAGVADADMDVTEAWARSTGAGVTVAVVDSGVQLDHPDLAGQVAANPGETGAGRETNGVDDDGNGLVDDWRGWDFVQADNNPADVQGHGTHVAGTVAAVNGNGQGISGAAPDARVLSLRTLDDNGSGYMSDTAEAFDLAGDMGVRVVNASLGGAGTSPAITQAVGATPTRCMSWRRATTRSTWRAAPTTSPARRLRRTCSASAPPTTGTRSPTSRTTARPRSTSSPPA